LIHEQKKSSVGQLTKTFLRIYAAKLAIGLCWIFTLITIHRV